MRMRNLIAQGRIFISVLTLTLVSAFHIPHSAYAAFEDSGTGARATALAGGYVAAADDMLSLLYNPAGLAQVHRKEVTSEYAKLFSGLSDGSNLSQTFLAYGQPIRTGGTLAVGWKQFSLSGLYSERTLSLGYGEWITPKVAAGVTLKQLHHEFTAPNIIVDDAGYTRNGTPSFFAQNGNAQTAYSADLGFLVKPMDRHTFGFSVQDLNEPNVALSPSDHDIVAKTLRLGWAYEAQRQLKLMAGVTQHKGLAHSNDVTWTGAAERWWDTTGGGAFAARGSLSSGSREFRQMVIGAGYRLRQLQLDYAFAFNIGGLGIGDTSGTHRFSMTYRFGPELDAKGRPINAPARKPSAKPQRDADIEALLNGEAPAVSPSDYQVPLTESAQTAAAAATASDEKVDAISRYQLIVRVQDMTTDFMVRTTRHASADTRLAALSPLYRTLAGYVRGSGAEMLEMMTQTDALDAARREDARLKYEGASATDRLSNWVKSLESVFGPALRARAWNTKDARDLRYRDWVGQAWAQHEALVRSLAAPEVRLDSIRRMASRALDFERMPSEPILEVAPIAVSSATAQSAVVMPEPAATPAAPLAPVAAPGVTPAVPVTPSTVTAPARKPAMAKGPIHKAPVVTKRPVETGSGEVPALYKVKEGDTLINLAERFYGDYKRWREIYILNEDRLGRGGNLKVGQLLIMPPKDKSKR